MHDWYDHHGAPLVALANDLEQQVGTVLVDLMSPSSSIDQQRLASDSGGAALRRPAHCAAARVLIMSTAVVKSTECPSDRRHGRGRWSSGFCRDRRYLMNNVGLRCDEGQVGTGSGFAGG